MINKKKILATIMAAAMIGLSTIKSVAYVSTPVKPVTKVESLMFTKVESEEIDIEPLLFTKANTKEIDIESLKIKLNLDETVNDVPESEPVIYDAFDETIDDVQPVSIFAESEPETNSGLALTEEDIQLLAWVTMAEAEGEPVEGKRLVIDTLLNRIEDDGFPDSAHGVVYQKNQFEAMWNGRSERCGATDEVVELVKEELVNRTDSEVLWFRSGHYHTFGTPVRSVGNHYFSTY